MHSVVVARALVVAVLVVVANDVAAVTLATVAPATNGADADGEEVDADADDEVDSQGMLQSPGLVLGGDGDLDVFIMSLPGSGPGRSGCE